MTGAAITTDLLVVGFGKGGKTLAADMGRQGRTVVLVEESALMYGGTCINTGCVPTKSMVYHGEHLPKGVPGATACGWPAETRCSMSASLPWTSRQSPSSHRISWVPA